MLSDATLTADIIKQFAKNAFDSTMPFSFHYGTVKSTDPIEIEVEQKLILTENDLIFTTLVQDFDVDMYMEHEVEETDLIHKHDIKIDTLNAGDYPCTSTHTITVQDSPDADKHIHEYKGVKTFTVNLKLAKDEKVLLLRIQGGQKFLVLDRVRTLNDTEFTDEFEGSGSSGSSGSGSGSNSGNTSGGGSTDSGGGNSGSTDSGNGGNDSGSTDNENPDTGDNGNNSDGSVSDVISVTALMTALLSLTDEQKKEIGLTGVTIDDENITDSSTWSSQKIQDSVNANTFEISKLNETTELSGECCIPIVQGTETKKIKVDTLQSELNDKINSLETSNVAIGTLINAINEKLPEQATNENKLADKDFVNSSISSNTAYFIGTFNSLSELQASNKTITKNDYAFIVETDDVGNIKYNRYKWNGSEWLFEYALNNSSFTSNQWKAINSNITEEWKNSIETDIETEIAERKSADTNLQNQINNKADSSQLSNKVDKVSGKGLSTNDYTTTEKNKLAGIATGANKTTVDSALSTSSTNPVQNKVVTSNINTLTSNVTDLGTKVTNLGNQITSLGNKVYTCSTGADVKNKTISIPNIDTPSIGTRITVLFTSGNIIANPTLGINGTSTDEIRVKQKGQIVSLNSARGTASYGAYRWDSNTLLELYYNGTYWIIINNPVVCQTYFSDLHNSYKVYADGWKEVTIKNTTSTVNTLQVALPISFSDKSYFATVESYDGEGRRKIHITEKGTTYLKINRVDYACKDWMIYAEGY